MTLSCCSNLEGVAEGVALGSFSCSLLFLPFSIFFVTRSCCLLNLHAFLFADNDIGEADVGPIADALRTNAALTSLDLSCMLPLRQTHLYALAAAMSLRNVRKSP